MPLLGTPQEVAEERRQRVWNPLARFLGSFFAARQRMNTPAGTARREAVRASKEEVVENSAFTPKLFRAIL